ncbi:MAG: hypothetical protein IT353_19035 [Gemmatimonadaceae bacterium]|nr:hypothetical protein [Gemmatimonadaceae bacterium]
MWADSLLALERGHLLRLAVWGGMSVVVGTLVLTLLVVRRAQAPFAKQFAIQTAAWGAIDLAICAWGWSGLALRDYAAATKLVNFLWLNTGLDAGYVMLGATLAIACWKLGPKWGGVGAGIAIVVQGAALLLLDLRLIFAIGTFQ